MRESSDEYAFEEIGDDNDFDKRDVQERPEEFSYEEVYRSKGYVIEEVKKKSHLKNTSDRGRNQNMRRDRAQVNKMRAVERHVPNKKTTTKPIEIKNVSTGSSNTSEFKKPAPKKAQMVSITTSTTDLPGLKIKQSTTAEKLRKSTPKKKEMCVIATSTTGLPPLRNSETNIDREEPLKRQATKKFSQMQTETTDASTTKETQNSSSSQKTQDSSTHSHNKSELNKNKVLEHLQQNLRSAKVDTEHNYFYGEPTKIEKIDLGFNKIKEAYKSIDGVKMTSTILNIDLDVLFKLLFSIFYFGYFCNLRIGNVLLFSMCYTGSYKKRLCR